jgi:hypothetical protein
MTSVRQWKHITGIGFRVHPNDENLKEIIEVDLSHRYKEEFGFCPFHVGLGTLVPSNLLYDIETTSDVLAWIKIINEALTKLNYNVNGYIDYKYEIDPRLGRININNNDFEHLVGVLIYVPEQYENIIHRVVQGYLKEPLKALIDIYLNKEEIK